VVCVGRSGLQVLDRYDEHQRADVAQAIDLSDGAYRQRFLAFMQHSSAHGDPDDDQQQDLMKQMALRSYAAQALRDDTMAESIARHLRLNPGRQLLHLSGDFHSSGFLGTVERLHNRLPELKIAVIHAFSGNDEQLQDAMDQGTIVIRVKSLPDNFKQDEHRQEWLQKVMQTRSQQRQNCP
jgi:uncharacterized iron-regulated protein